MSPLNASIKQGLDFGVQLRSGQQNLSSSSSGLFTFSGCIETTCSTIQSIQVQRQLPSIKSKCLVFRKCSGPNPLNYCRRTDIWWKHAASNNWPLYYLTQGLREKNGQEQLCWRQSAPTSKWGWSMPIAQTMTACRFCILDCTYQLTWIWLVNATRWVIVTTSLSN